MAVFRKLKRTIADALARPDWLERMSELDDLPPRKITAPLLALRLDREEMIRWRACVALGIQTARLAEESMEQARVLMRTYMWYMNEESGNLGWGIPEAMAETMVRNERLADEFGSILASYIFCDEDCDGNFLDHPELRRGVYWGLGRLAQERPELVSKSVRFILRGLEEPDPHNRGFAAWTLGILGEKEARARLRELVNDTAMVRIYRGDQIEEITVGQLAGESLKIVG